MCRQVTMSPSRTPDSRAARTHIPLGCLGRSDEVATAALSCPLLQPQSYEGRCVDDAALTS